MDEVVEAQYGVSETKQEAKGRKQPSALKNFLAGGVGGVCLVMTGHPLDTIKVRLQTQPKPAPGEKPMFTGTFNCAYKTVKNEGFLGLYRGLFAPLLVVTPLTSVYFLGYGIGKKLQQSTPSEKLTLGQHSMAGMFAGAFMVPLLTPADRVKCLMQIQQDSPGKARYSSSIDCAKQLFREGGIRSVYRGTTVTLLREMPANGIFFYVYEYILRTLNPEAKSRDELSPAHILFAGGMGGMALWVYAIVPDTLKSRYQTAPDGRYKGARSVFRELMRTEGPTALFRGLTPIMLRAFPANGACILGFEIAMRVLNWILPTW